MPDTVHSVGMRMNIHLSEATAKRFNEWRGKEPVGKALERLMDAAGIGTAPTPEDNKKLDVSVFNEWAVWVEGELKRVEPLLEMLPALQKVVERARKAGAL